MAEISARRVVEQLATLGVRRSGVLLVHTSFSGLAVESAWRTLVVDRL